MAFKWRASVGCNKGTEANFEEDMLHECGGKCGGVKGVKLGGDGKSVQVAHDTKEALDAAVSGCVPWLPDVDVNDGPGG